ncbi:hypothetical protein BU24DRAFT_458789 [Aaosphaeria arxii CBS 175.79]|uniref:Magnesium transporter n=1 Tax=Aaosphaeria arxii CBS 175.79 TaxID=1450172 RepID=A0A6A5Y2G6_9PLEO|nr:uncharacterized protein BU24DRAFT_458789 [Aaosphaeria arxii CBS 175.79]KAF2019081.1 hypothetical protein BU24DRAFT_458789 [Aaosphaeria arxii CBS 175.79]
MTFLSTTLNTLGALFLTHAVYSTHEHTTTAASGAHAPLPLDITLELLLSLLLLTSGIVLSSPALKPIHWARWSGKIAREGRKGEGEWTREGEEVLAEGDPYEFLGLEGGIGGKGGEGRRGFWDVGGKRGEYEAWVRGQS